MPDYTRYAGDRFVGPTGISSFPMDVSDGALLATTGSLAQDNGIYIKILGNWTKVTESAFIQETGITTGVTDEILLTGITGVLAIKGTHAGQSDGGEVFNLSVSEQVRCFVGGAIQGPDKYTLSNTGPGGTPKIQFTNNILSGVRTQVLYNV